MSENTLSYDFQAKHLRKVMRSLGLIENTTKRQKKNGTISFADPDSVFIHAKPNYTFHFKTGYVRRTKIELCRYRGGMKEVRYQLNPTTQFEVRHPKWTTLHTRRTLYPGDLHTLCMLAVPKIIRYRVYQERFNPAKK